MEHTTGSLIEGPSKGPTLLSIVKPVYFWKPNEENGFLSQWSTSLFAHGGTAYVNTEQWMMIQKARLFGDTAAEKRMLQTINPGLLRKLGRSVKGYSIDRWDQGSCPPSSTAASFLIYITEKYRIVVQGNCLKFMVSNKCSRAGGYTVSHWKPGTGQGERYLQPCNSLISTNATRPPHMIVSVASDLVYVMRPIIVDGGGTTYWARHSWR